ncbi:hypothetical protein N665_2321s0002 [Sinapis alba]|nr:hypothetical protein N665_2321s0002 [Sinapis alba]
MPVFNGTNPHGWIARVERFFRHGLYTEVQKMQLVSMSLEGVVLNWFLWEEKHVAPQNWSSFKQRLIKRFRHPHMRSPKESLAALVQTGPVTVYLQHFEELSSQVTGVDNEMLEAIFKGGLKKRVAGDSSSQGTSRFSSHDRHSVGDGGWTIMSSNGHSSWKTRPVSLPASTSNTEKTMAQPVNNIRRQLTPAKYEYRRKNKLCYRCDDRHNFGQACPNKNLQVLTVVDGCEVELFEEELGDTGQDNKDVFPELMELSLNAFWGVPSLTTTKLRGLIGKVEIVVMLDSGATHNFITPNVVKRARLRVHLRTVLDIFRQAVLFANEKKCSFGVAKIKYLGHVISAEGVATDRAKTVAMTRWPIPKTVKELRGFLGLTGYYRRFIKGYGMIAKPLTTLLKKDEFMWTPEAQVAFDHLIQAMVQAPVLSLPDFSEPFIIESDASGTGLGAVLMQKKNPIAYFSHVITEKEQLKPIYELSCANRPKELEYLLEQREVNLEYQKWLHKLLGYDFEIVYKPSIENKSADGLSRVVHPVFDALMKITLPKTLQLEDILREVELCQWIQELIRDIRGGKLVKKNYSVSEDKLLYKRRLVIPASSVHIPLILQEFHGSMLGGLLQPLPVPDRIWDDVPMDFIEGLPLSEGINVILVVVDRLSKFGHFVGLRHPFTAVDVASKFMT